MSMDQRQVHPMELKNAINDSQNQLTNLVNTLYKAFQQQSQQLTMATQELQRLKVPTPKKSPESASELKPKIKVNTKNKSH